MSKFNYTMYKVIFTALAAFMLSLNARAGDNDFQKTTDKALAAGNPEAVLKALNRETYRGNLIAAQQLGLMYRDGNMVSRDLDKAQKFLKIAASTNLNRIWYRYGLVEAQYTLGVMLQTANKPDLSEAESWYSQAAQLGHVQSQLALARMYISGTGIKRDPERAFHWASIAAASLPEAEQKEAAQIRDQSQLQIDPKRIAKARAQVSEWKPKKSS